MKFNIVMPMSGRGQRFTDAGFTTPKPFLDVRGIPLFRHAFNSIGDLGGNVFYVVRKEHMENQLCRHKMSVYANNGTIIESDGPYKGQLGDALLAADRINNDDPLIICNCDHKLSYDKGIFFQKFSEPHQDGGIISFYSDNPEPKYSYIAIDGESGRVTEIAEKRKISSFATAGIYAFSRGRDFVNYGSYLVNNNTDGKELYVSGVYAKMIGYGYNFFSVICDKMITIGTPEEFAASYNIHNADPWS